VERKTNRREVLRRSAATVALAGGVLHSSARRGTGVQAAGSKPESADEREFQIGMVTYFVAHDWTLETILKRYPELGLKSVEFRSTHKHGVEPTLSKQDRKDVKKRCADAGVVIWGIGSACEYHAADPAVVEQNVEETQRFAELAHDVGAKGVKVRPNGFPDGVDQAKTLEQIGKALNKCGRAAADMGVEIWCENHGRGTSEIPNMRKIMDVADHDNVGVVWNSNRGVSDRDGKFDEFFDMLRPKIYSVHINELVNGYPYRELFQRLRETGYDRYTMIEAKPISDKEEENVRFLQFYIALWNELCRPV
jgi:sugar phosphate isomerase/epimerase